MYVADSETTSSSSLPGSALATVVTEPEARMIGKASCKTVPHIEILCFLMMKVRSRRLPWSSAVLVVPHRQTSNTARSWLDEGRKGREGMMRHWIDDSTGLIAPVRFHVSGRLLAVH